LFAREKKRGEEGRRRGRAEQERRRAGEQETRSGEDEKPRATWFDTAEANQG